MKNPLIFLLALAFAGVAHAQSYKWIDKDGKTRYGDTPPPGVKATALKGSSPSPSAASPGAAAKGKDAKTGPPTSAEKEDRENAERERQAKAKHAQDCAGVRAYLRTLESGEPIARSGAAGKGNVMNEGQIVEAVTNAKRTIKLVCSS